ncbi:MAG TPA: DNA polymerase III subunit delta [Rhodospirillaceae bacterium]|nr:DNA polymerase III subunit delta [Rhodospirillaceae bacterium]
MKLTGSRIESFLKAPDAKIRVALVYGPDAGLIQERLDRLTKTIVPDLNDPFRIANFPAARLKEDPSRLADEAAALCMTGGRRVVRVTDAQDAFASVLKAFLSHPLGDALVLVEAGELTPRSPLRQLAEQSELAVALPCYADEGSGLESVIHETLRGYGLTAEPDAVAWLAEHLGGDRLMTRSELNKLALYMGSGSLQRVKLEDAAACVGDSALLSMDDLGMAAADGDHATAQRVLERLFRDGTSPVAILRSLTRHFLRLHLTAGAFASGQSIEQSLAALKPPVHFRSQSRMQNQIRRWTLPRLSSALELLLTAEIDSKTTGMPAAEICSRAVMQLAQAANRGRKENSQR